MASDFEGQPTAEPPNNSVNVSHSLTVPKQSAARSSGSPAALTYKMRYKRVIRHFRTVDADQTALGDEMKNCRRKERELQREVHYLLDTLLELEGHAHGLVIGDLTNIVETTYPEDQLVEASFNVDRETRLAQMLQKHRPTVPRLPLLELPERRKRPYNRTAPTIKSRKAERAEKLKAKKARKAYASDQYPERDGYLSPNIGQPIHGSNGHSASSYPPDNTDQGPHGQAPRREDSELKPTYAQDLEQGYSRRESKLYDLPHYTGTMAPLSRANALSVSNLLSPHTNERRENGHLPSPAIDLNHVEPDKQIVQAPKATVEEDLFDILGMEPRAATKSAPPMTEVQSPRHYAQPQFAQRQGPKMSVADLVHDSSSPTRRQYTIVNKNGGDFHPTEDIAKWGQTDGWTHKT